MISDIVTLDVIYNSDFWDGDHHVISLSGYPGYLETDTRVFALFVLYIALFIQKYAIRNHPIKHFSPIIGGSSLM